MLGAQNSDWQQLVRDGRVISQGLCALQLTGVKSLKPAQVDTTRGSSAGGTFRSETAKEEAFRGDKRRGRQKEECRWKDKDILPITDAATWGPQIDKEWENGPKRRAKEGSPLKRENRRDVRDGE